MMRKACKFLLLLFLFLQSTSFAFETNSCPQNRFNNIESLRQLSTLATDDASWGARRSTAQTGAGQELVTCTNLDKINQLKQYLNCRTSLRFAACAGVAAAVAGRAVAVAGARSSATAIEKRVLLARFDNKLPKIRAKATERMRTLLGRQRSYVETSTFVDDRGRSHPISRTEKMRLINPLIERERLYEQAVDNILAEVRAGIARGETAVIEDRVEYSTYRISESFMNTVLSRSPELARNLRAMDDQVRLTGEMSKHFKSNILNQVDDVLSRTLFSADRDFQNMPYHGPVTNTYVRGVLEAAELDSARLERASLMRAIPRRFPAWALGGGTVGFAIAVGSEILRPSPTGCDTIGRYPRDPDNNCAPIYQVDQGVVNFLNERPAVQLAELRNPNSGSCDFYKTLHSQMFEQPRFVGLRCGTPTSRSITLTTRDKNGARLAHTILYNSNNKVTQMNVRNEVGSPAGFNRWSRTVMFNQDGTFQNQNSNAVVQTVQNTRLYVPDAVNCCLTSDSALKQRCLTEYNR